MLSLTCMRLPLTSSPGHSTTATVGSGKEALKTTKPGKGIQNPPLPSKEDTSVNVGQLFRGGLPRLVAPKNNPSVWDEVFTPPEEIDQLDIKGVGPLFIRPEQLKVAKEEGIATNTPKTDGNPISNNYELTCELGRGSYGTVYAAMDRETGHEVAIKEVRRIEGCSVLSECKIRQEVDVLDDLKQCSSVVKIHGSYEMDEKMYIITELCKGGDLETYLKTNGPMNEQQVALVVVEALKMLRECHSRKIVHGDVKPANFVIANQLEYKMFRKGNSTPTNGWLKGIDFGTSQYTGRGRCSNKVGTPVHWAPEVFAGSYHIEADMWSLGVMMYRLMTGRLPFWDNYQESELKSEKDILKGVIYKTPDFTGEPWTKVSPECVEFLKSLLDKNYEKRLTVDMALIHPFLSRNLKKSQIFSFGFVDQIIITQPASKPSEAFQAAA